MTLVVKLALPFANPRSASGADRRRRLDSTHGSKAQTQAEADGAERHARFKELAREVGAEGEAADFDDTVKRLAAQPKESEVKKPGR